MRIIAGFIFPITFLILSGFVTNPALSAAPRKTTAVSVKIPTPTPSPIPTILPVDAYVLFWPIAPGKVMGDSLYPLKGLKEAVREFFIFGDVNKAEYNITLSEKRTVEAEYLFTEKKDYIDAVKTLDIAQQRREKARDIYLKAKTQKTTGNLQNKLILSLEKQKSLLTYLITQAPEDQKQAMESNIARLNGVLMSIQ